jgi:hypothetical protein
MAQRSVPSGARDLTRAKPPLTANQGRDQLNAAAMAAMTAPVARARLADLGVEIPPATGLGHSLPICPDGNVRIDQQRTCSEL